MAAQMIFYKPDCGFAQLIVIIRIHVLSSALAKFQIDFKQPFQQWFTMRHVNRLSERIEIWPLIFRPLILKLVADCIDFALDGNIGIGQFQNPEKIKLEYLFFSPIYDNRRSINNRVLEPGHTKANIVNHVSNDDRRQR